MYTDLRSSGILKWAAQAEKDEKKRAKKEA
jgi:hypothetical protein